jgi:hypothetical protein
MDTVTSIEDYLADLDLRLCGLVSAEERDRLVGETAFWLERQVRDQLLQGVEEPQAVTTAIRRHGPTRSVAVMLASQQFEQGVDSYVLNKVGRANAIAGSIFGIGNVVYLFLLQLALFLPADSVRWSASPAQIRSFFPEPLPFPERSWQFAVTIGYPVLAPFLLGWLAGRCIPANAHVAVYRAMAPILLATFVMGCFLLPNTYGLVYALSQIAFWLPVGCSMAYMTSTIARKKRAKTEMGNSAGTRAPSAKQIGAT